LADIARTCAGHDRVLSSGTYLDSLRFRVHLAEKFAVDPAHVEAQVLGDHGTSQVFMWSGARIAGVPASKLIERRGESPSDFRQELEQALRYANISIIEGNEASQFGIGIVSARIAEMVMRDERAAIPIGSFNKEFGVTLSLPSVVRSRGVIEILEPELTSEERCALERSAANLKTALAREQKSGG
jgi:L-lactate dehydrogenase